MNPPVDILQVAEDRLAWAGITLDGLGLLAPGASSARAYTRALMWLHGAREDYHAVQRFQWWLEAQDHA